MDKKTLQEIRGMCNGQIMLGQIFQLIVHDVPKLVDEVERLQTRLDEADKILKTIYHLAYDRQVQDAHEIIFPYIRRMLEEKETER